jgi:hypothetical protein
VFIEAIWAFTIAIWVFTMAIGVFTMRRSWRSPSADLGVHDRAKSARRQPLTA